MLVAVEIFKYLKGVLEHTLLPALDRLARTRHSGTDLDAVAAAFVEAEKNCPGICDEFIVELLTAVAYPQATESELQAAVDRLTTYVSLFLDLILFIEMKIVLEFKIYFKLLCG